MIIVKQNANTVDGEEAADIVTNARVKAHFPDTLANVLSDHNKAAHDALNIDADTLDGSHAGNEANKMPILNALGVMPLSVLPGISCLPGSLAVGSDILHAHDDTVSTKSTSYVKVKTITLGYLPATTLRISLTLTENYNGQWVHGKIYRNGGAVGTERSRSSVGSSTWEEDIAGWSKGDTLELWLDVFSGLWAGHASNFRILGDLAETELSNSTP